MCPFIYWELRRDTPTSSFSPDAGKESSLLPLLFINKVKLLTAKKKKKLKKIKRKAKFGQPVFQAGCVIPNTQGMFEYQLKEHHFAKVWNASQEFLSIVKPFKLFLSSKI